MEDDLNLLANIRQPQVVGNWKTMSIGQRLEEHIKFLVNGRRPQYLFELNMTRVSYQAKLAKLALASPELDTAQPQLVLVSCLV